MIRLFFVAFFLCLFLIFSTPLIIYERILLKSNPDKSRRQSLAIIKWAFRCILWIAGVKIVVKGKEHIQVDQPALYVGNHRSYFDILIGYTLMPNPSGFVAKKEMEKIPLLSSWMHLVCCLFLDRDNIKEGLKTILQGIDYVKQGISIWIFPEGTRNRQEIPSNLDTFKEGSMKIAEKSGCPIIPVALTGADDIFEKHKFKIKSGTILVEFGAPIIISELEKEEKKFLGSYTRDRIVELLEKHST